MARNYEKRYTGLNRFLEAKQQEGSQSKAPRPPLHKLKTAEEAKKWIPSIRKEIEYCLQQISGVESRNYPEHKLKEFQERVEQLEREHQRFVEKVHALDPHTRGSIPWQPRAYSRKRMSHDSHVTQKGPPRTKRLCSPLVQQEKELVNTTVATLTLSTPTNTALVTPEPHHLPVSALLKPKPHSSKEEHGKRKKEGTTNTNTSPSHSRGVLGLGYSSSSEEDVES